MKKILFIMIAVIAIIGCGSDKETTLNGRIDLKILSSDDISIKIGWNSIPDVTGYKLYRNNVLISNIGGGVVEYIDTGLYMGSGYNYYVVGYRGSRETDPSNVATATTKDYKDLIKYCKPSQGNIKWLEISKTGNKIGYGTVEDKVGIYNFSSADINSWDFIPNGKYNLQITNITSFCINDSGTKLIVGNKDGDTDGIGISSPLDRQNTTIQGINYLTNDDLVITTEGGIGIFGHNTGNLEMTFKGVGVSQALEDGKKLIFSLKDETAADKMIIAYNDGSVTVNYGEPYQEIIPANTVKKMKYIKISNNNRIVINSYENDNIIYIRNIYAGNSMDKWKNIVATINAPSNIDYVDLNEDGSRIVLAGINKNIYLYNGTGNLIKAFNLSQEIGEDRIKGVAISPDNKIIAVAIENQIKFYRLEH